MRNKKVKLEFNKIPSVSTSPFDASVAGVWARQRIIPVPLSSNQKLSYTFILHSYCLENGLNPKDAPEDLFRDRSLLSDESNLGGKDAVYVLGPSTINGRMIGHPTNVQHLVEMREWVVNGKWRIRLGSVPRALESYLVEFPGGETYRGTAYQINAARGTFNMGFGRSEYLHDAIQVMQRFQPSSVMRRWDNFLPEDTTAHIRRKIEKALGIDKKHLGHLGTYWGLGSGGDSLSGIAHIDTKEWDVIKSALLLRDKVMSQVELMEDADGDFIYE